MAHHFSLFGNLLFLFFLLYTFMLKQILFLFTLFGAFGLLSFLVLLSTAAVFFLFFCLIHNLAHTHNSIRTLNCGAHKSCVCLFCGANKSTWMVIQQAHNRIESFLSAQLRLRWWWMAVGLGWLDPEKRMSFKIRVDNFFWLAVI